MQARENTEILPMSVPWISVDDGQLDLLRHMLCDSRIQTECNGTAARGAVDTMPVFVCLGTSPTGLTAEFKLTSR